VWNGLRPRHGPSAAADRAGAMGRGRGVMNSRAAPDRGGANPRPFAPRTSGALNRSLSAAYAAAPGNAVAVRTEPAMSRRSSPSAAGAWARFRTRRGRPARGGAATPAPGSSSASGRNDTRSQKRPNSAERRPMARSFDVTPRWGARRRRARRTRGGTRRTTVVFGGDSVNGARSANRGRRGRTPRRCHRFRSTGHTLDGLICSGQMEFFRRSPDSSGPDPARSSQVGS